MVPQVDVSYAYDTTRPAFAMRNLMYTPTTVRVWLTIHSLLVAYIGR